MFGGKNLKVEQEEKLLRIYNFFSVSFSNWKKIKFGYLYTSGKIVIGGKNL
jgi:hypothetical protein